MRAGHDKNPPAAPPGPVFDAGTGGIVAGGYLFIAFLGVPDATVRTRLARGRAKLKDVLDEGGTR